MIRKIENIIQNFLLKLLILIIFIIIDKTLKFRLHTNNRRNQLKQLQIISNFHRLSLFLEVIIQSIFLLNMGSKMPQILIIKLLKKLNSFEFYHRSWLHSIRFLFNFRFKEQIRGFFYLFFKHIPFSINNKFAQNQISNRNDFEV